jgi:hypothetical protein
MTAIGQQKWDDKDKMVMGGQRHPEWVHVLRHPSKATIN